VPFDASTDTNARIGALLRDLAAVQTAKQSRFGYKRAAAAILNLDEPIEALLQSDGTLRKIPNVGPSSTRVILEVLRTGGSAIVDAAVQASNKTRDIERSRGLREHFLSRARVVSILNDRSIRAIRREDYLGDFQMHSVWSDGGDTIADLATACAARGYRHCAITDHSYGLPIARGVSMASLSQQHGEIDRLNKRLGRTFRVLKGIEANIRADGEVDMLPEERRELDLVLAAPHSKLRLAEDQTARVIAAVSTPGVHILAHPRGRMLGSRAGIIAQWDNVFAAAAARGVAIEIDGDPSRQDLDFTLAKKALKAGCFFALDSDAHSTGELRYADTAIAHARLAGIPAARVINTWSLDRLMEWAARLRT
jgi:putative hydrolase